MLDEEYKVKFASGGIVPKQTEEIRTMLLPGEVRVPKAVIKKYGIEFLKAINVCGHVPGRFPGE